MSMLYKLKIFILLFLFKNNIFYSKLELSDNSINIDESLDILYNNSFINKQDNEGINKGINKNNFFFNCKNSIINFKKSYMNLSFLLNDGKKIFINIIILCFLINILFNISLNNSLNYKNLGIFFITNEKQQKLLIDEIKKNNPNGSDLTDKKYIKNIKISFFKTIKNLTNLDENQWEDLKFYYKDNNGKDIMIKWNDNNKLIEAIMLYHEGMKIDNFLKDIIYGFQYLCSTYTQHNPYKINVKLNGIQSFFITCWDYIYFSITHI